mgnify:FL=1
MNITSVKYISPAKGESESSILNATIDGIEMFVPMDVYNRQYAAILKWVEEGNTIQDADKEVLTWDSIRATRNQILRDTDWTMTTGATVDQAQWAAYRQNLRDLPQTYKDKTPDDVVWPTQPSTKGPNS